MVSGGLPDTLSSESLMLFRMKSGNFNLKAFFSGNGFQGAVSGDVAKPATCYALQCGGKPARYRKLINAACILPKAAFLQEDAVMIAAGFWQQQQAVTRSLYRASFRFRAEAE
jgi:hypothetical protein